MAAPADASGRRPTFAETMAELHAELDAAASRNLEAEGGRFQRMSGTENQSTRVARLALDLPYIAKRRLHRSLARAILSNSSDLKAEVQALHADIATVEGQVRHQRITASGDHDEQQHDA